MTALHGKRCVLKGSECGKGGRPKKSDESGNTDEKADTAASADNAEEKPQGINDTAEIKSFFTNQKVFRKAKKLIKI